MIWINLLLMFVSLLVIFGLFKLAIAFFMSVYRSRISRRQSDRDMHNWIKRIEERRKTYNR